jgi:hypothetical protein
MPMIITAHAADEVMKSRAACSRMLRGVGEVCGRVRRPSWPGARDELALRAWSVHPHATTRVKPRTDRVRCSTELQPRRVRQNLSVAVPEATVVLHSHCIRTGIMRSQPARHTVGHAGSAHDVPPAKIWRSAPEECHRLQPHR